MLLDTLTISLDNTRRVARLIAPHVRRTPLIRSDAAARLGAGDIFVKCENRQHTGSFKLRGAMSALHGYPLALPDAWAHMRRRGVVTCSSGNFARGLAHATAQLGLDCTIVVPRSISAFKWGRILRQNPAARVHRVDHDAWRRMMIAAECPELPGYFLSSESDSHVSLGNATIALEILEDLPDVDAVFVPFGGGNLAFSVASLLARARPEVKVYAVEVSTGAPLSASLRADRPVAVEHSQTFVDGIGASFVIPWQFHRLRDLLAGVLTVTPREISVAIAGLACFDDLRLEGAGAAAFAAARKYAHVHGFRRPCAVATGGSIAPDVLRTILRTVSPDETLKCA